jgi:hypothetical protein
MQDREFYLCMRCGKIYDKNPGVCKWENGKVYSEVHSRFSSKYDCIYTYVDRGTSKAYERTSDISQWIFKFRVGQIKSLRNAPHFLGQTPQYILERNGFRVIAQYSYNNGCVYKPGKKRTLEKVESFMNSFNRAGKNYLLFSSSCFPGVTFWTFMTM